MIGELFNSMADEMFGPRGSENRGLVGSFYNAAKGIAGLDLVTSPPAPMPAAPQPGLTPF